MTAPTSSRPPAPGPTVDSERAYAAFVFEGRMTPDADTLDAVLPALLQSGDRDWLLRAAVVSEQLAEAVIDAADSMLDREVGARSAALAAARALAARRLVPPIGARMCGRGWLGCPDPGARRHTLAQQALAFVIETLGPTAATPYLEQAIALPELRLVAYGALAAESADKILPHLADLLTESPGLAADVATRFALVHPEACQAACQAISGVPRAARQQFGVALRKHLERTGQIRNWVACRRLLFGR